MHVTDCFKNITDEVRENGQFYVRVVLCKKKQHKARLIHIWRCFLR